jgi:hypothetical protein
MGRRMISGADVRAYVVTIKEGCEKWRALAAG